MKIIIILGIVLIVIVGAAYFLIQPKYRQNIEPSQIPASSNQPVVNGTNVSQKTYNITIENFSFNPAETNIKNGDTVIWTNQDSMAHRISGEGFNSDVLSKGQSFSFAPSTTGTINYICSIHPSMKGKIIVQ